MWSPLGKWFKKKKKMFKSKNGRTEQNTKIVPERDCTDRLSYKKIIIRRKMRSMRKPHREVQTREGRVRALHVSYMHVYAN